MHKGRSVSPNMLSLISAFDKVILQSPPPIPRPLSHCHNTTNTATATTLHHLIPILRLVYILPYPLTAQPPHHRSTSNKGDRSASPSARRSDFVKVNPGAARARPTTPGLEASTSPLAPIAPVRPRPNANTSSGLKARSRRYGDVVVNVDTLTALGTSPGQVCSTNMIEPRGHHRHATPRHATSALGYMHGSTCRNNTRFPLPQASSSPPLITAGHRPRRIDASRDVEANHQEPTDPTRQAQHVRGAVRGGGGGEQDDGFAHRSRSRSCHTLQQPHRYQEGVTTS